MTNDIGPLECIAVRAHGLVSVGELRAAGISDERRRTLVQRGVLRPVGRRVFRLAGSPSTERQRVLAACCELGAVASHRTAAALHGLSGFALGPPVEVMVRDRRQSARSSLGRVHTTTWLPPDDVVVVDAIPSLGLARTLFSLAALVPEVPRVDLTDAVEEALATGRAREAWLWWHLERTRRRGRNGVSEFEAAMVSAVAAGPTESWLERETIRVIRAADLPQPVCQARIKAQGAFVARVDFSYPGTTAILEVNGHRFHSSRAQLQRDAERRRKLVGLGHAVYDFTYDDVVKRPESIVAVIRAILGLAEDG